MRTACNLMDHFQAGGNYTARRYRTDVADMCEHLRIGDLGSGDGTFGAIGLDDTAQATNLAGGPKDTLATETSHIVSGPTTWEPLEEFDFSETLGSSGFDFGSDNFGMEDNVFAPTGSIDTDWSLFFEMAAER